MRQHPDVLTVSLLFLLAAPLGVPAQSPRSPAATLYEGARLVNSDGSAPIDNSAFLVTNNRFVAIGRKGEIALPDGATRIDLTGKTVIPALIDAHSHLGYMKGLTIGPQNYTEDNLIDHLQRHAYHGVAVGSTWGSDFGGTPFSVQVRDAPNAARFVTLGRGITTPGEGTPENMRQAAHVCATEEDCRSAVRENAAQKLRLVKIWVQDRPAGISKMSPALYRATIDEARKRGMGVVAHATVLADVKDLLLAGVSGFAHIPTEVDAEFMAMLKENPSIFFTPTLGTSRRLIYSPWLDAPDPLIVDTIAPAQIARLKARVAAQPPEVLERGRQNWERTRTVMRALVDAGVPIALGSDAGGMSGDQFVGWTAHTEIENMVAAGMTPAQALVACTRRSAQVLGLTDMGFIAIGNSADFIVLDADPLVAITNTRRISRVVLRGNEVDRGALKAKWAKAMN